MSNLFEKKILKNLQKNEINSIELIDLNWIAACSSEELFLYDIEKSKFQSLYKIKSGDTEELNYLKCLNDSRNYLFASNEQYLQVFDLNSLKQISKYKPSKETINSIELNKSLNCLAICDDLGEIKIFDLRMKFENEKNNQGVKIPNLLMKKTLKTHSNICCTIKFNPENENELFSGSFDCSILKWDLRSINNKNPYINKINISETLMETGKSNELNDDYFVSSMTPCFVHTICLDKLNEKMMLLAGIENGLCIVYDASTCEYKTQLQIQPFNTALTQLFKTDDFFIDLLVSSQNETEKKKPENLIAASGNGKTIEFIYLMHEPLNEAKTEANNTESSLIIRLEKLRSTTLKIDHQKKINSLKYFNKRIFVADTSNNLTIYDFNK